MRFQPAFGYFQGSTSRINSTAVVILLCAVTDPSFTDVTSHLSRKLWVPMQHSFSRPSCSNVPTACAAKSTIGVSSRLFTHQPSRHFSCVKIGPLHLVQLPNCHKISSSCCPPTSAAMASHVTEGLQTMNGGTVMPRPRTRLTNYGITSGSVVTSGRKSAVVSEGSLPTLEHRLCSVASKPRSMPVPGSIMSLDKPLSIWPKSWRRMDGSVRCCL
jgi:hypothetical protein